jgi:hypothetical protein
MTHALHRRWLKAAAIIVGGFAPILSLGTMPATAEPARWSLDLLGWPLDGATTWSSPDTRFLSALAGGFLLGWGVMIWCLSAWVYDAAPDAVRRTFLISVLSWFVFDSAGSIASGNASNAGFNVLILLAVVGPLWRPARGQPG